jgi:hypothetical protein
MAAPNDFDKNPRDPEAAAKKTTAPGPVGTHDPKKADEKPAAVKGAAAKKGTRTAGDPDDPNRAKTTEELAEERRQARARDGALDTRQNPKTGKHPDEEGEDDDE